MNFDAEKFRDDVRTALDLLESHGVTPAKFFIRQATADAIRAKMLEIGYSEEEAAANLAIDGVHCAVWVETLH